ncbi:hypothetical protein AOQ84DRAFT_381976 [Glonium stellatum]|uniref:Uncharacterized protein n=1 Tax=Glonium stellatum TaxID=574774 RepID=A0A8E2EQM5_9PEZI|nr:hypothetical protein AOQ84DRAFT_381976 [Glonium stellatum]
MSATKKKEPFKDLSEATFQRYIETTEPKGPSRPASPHQSNVGVRGDGEDASDEASSADVKGAPSDPESDCAFLDLNTAVDNKFGLDDEDKAIITAYLNEPPSLHVRRTLDQYYYHMLSNTKQRDEDQVVLRWAIILVFTVVAAIFLPLLFMASFFAINVLLFPQDPKTGQTSWPLEKVSGYTSIPFLVIAFKVEWVISNFETLAYDYLISTLLFCVRKLRLLRIEELNRKTCEWSGKLKHRRALYMTAHDEDKKEEAEVVEESEPDQDVIN